MAHVFISYSRQDAQIIDRLVRDLEAAAIKVWIDREDIPGGAKWRRQIVDAIEGADAVLVALSPSAAVSDNVQKELGIAEEAKKPVIPVEIRRTVVPKEMVWHLVDLQRIDLATSFDVGVKRLVDSIRALLRAPQAFVRLSPEARNEIKELMIDPALSANERLSLASLILLKDSDRIREKSLADLLQLDDRAQKRMDLRDQLHGQGGSSLETYVLDKQQEEDKLKRKLILEQMEWARKISELALSQLKEVVSAGQRAIKGIWGKGTPESS
jgi:hypothetical protein